MTHRDVFEGAHAESAGAPRAWSPWVLAAVYFAHRDRMDLTLSVTVGSTIQVALLTAPLLVLVSRPTWFEGVLLLAVCVVLGLAFFFAT